MSSTYSSEVAAAYDRVAGRYADFYASSADLADSDVIFARARRCHRGGVLVDLGCGPGVALSWRVATARQYRGVDLSPGAIEAARTRWPGYRFTVGDEHSLPSRTCSFILGGFAPLPHVPDLDRFSRQLERALISGGRFLIMAEPTGRPVHILGDGVRTYARSAAELREAFQWARRLHVYGHRRFAPGSIPRWLQRALLRLERLLPLDPDRCCYIVIEGRKP